MRHFLAVAALAAALAFGCAPALAQNAICPDVAAGDSSQRCANTKFVGTAVAPPSATANQIPVFPGGGGAPVPTSATTWFDNAYCSTVGWVIVRTTGAWTCAQGIPADVKWFGAACNGSGDDSSAILAAIAAIPSGGTVAINNPNCRITSQIVIAKTMTLRCGPTNPTVGSSITQVTTSANGIVIRSGHVIIDGCTVGMAGSPTGTSTGILIGDDTLQKSGAFNNGNTTVTCATCSFTAGDVGKSFNAIGMGVAGGPLLTNIAIVTDATHVVVGVAPGATNAATTFSYGFDYQEIILQNVKSYNFTRGLNIVAASRYHILQSYFLAADPAIIQNQLWGDTGDGEIIGTHFVASVAGSHDAVLYQSGGGLRFLANKVLAQAAISNCVHIQWNFVPSIGPEMATNSIEGPCVNGINIDGSVALDAGTITGGEIAVGGTGIAAAPTVAHPSWAINGVAIRASANNTGMSFANMTALNVVGSVVQNTDASPSGTAYVISGTASGYLNAGFTSQTNTLSNASASMVLDNPQGMTFANLPGVAANGSRIYVTDGTPGSTPCTGGGTGATAFRQNGAWSCGAPIAANSVTNASLAQMATKTIKGNNTGGTANAADLTIPQVSALFTLPTVQTFLSGSGTYTRPANVTWIEIELQGGGGGGGGSGTTPGAATAGGNSCWNTSGAACTTPVYQAGGGALGGTVGIPSAGGTISGSGTCNIMALAGGSGQAGSGSASVPGGNGGVSKFGGSGWAGGPGQAGTAAATNSGSGGGGAGDSATPNTGSGGAAGAYCRTIISSPAATYTYAVGAAGAAGTAGTSGSAGAAGGAGGIYVIEHYN